METDEKAMDDLLKKLIQDHEDLLESPSAEFISGVMEKIPPASEIIPETRPFYLSFRNIISLLGVLVLSVIIIITSDIPYIQHLPGASYLTDTLWPYLIKVFSGGIFSSLSVYLSFGLIIGAATILLLIADRYLINRISIKKGLSGI